MAYLHMLVPANKSFSKLLMIAGWNNSSVAILPYYYYNLGSKC